MRLGEFSDLKFLFGRDASGAGRKSEIGVMEITRGWWLFNRAE